MANYYDYDLIVIGGGAAGLTATAGAAQLGAKTLLIEREDRLGGDCLHYGCVPSKTLIRTARLYHQMKNAESFGLPPIKCPPVDFPAVRKHIQGVIATIQRHDSPERFCRLGAEVRFGSPEFIDEHSITLDGRSLSSKKFLIATGSSPALPPIEGLERVHFHTNKTIFSMDELPDRLVILGGGAIAVEMAQAFSRLGSHVTVIQRSERILRNEDEDCANAILGFLEEEGVRFLLGTKVRGITSGPQGKGVKVVLSYASRDEEAMVEGDALLVALGRSANVAELALKKAGVKSTSKGIAVDHRLRTTQPNIFAAGDVIGKYQFTHAAGYEGGIVVTNAIFRIPKKADYTLMPRCIYTDPELAIIGRNELELKANGEEYEVIKEPFDESDRAICERAQKGFIKLILSKSGTPIGVEILGARAGDLIGYWVAGLYGKVKPATLAQAVMPYPTFGEINKRPISALLSRKIFSPAVKKGLRFFFNLKGRACT